MFSQWANFLNLAKHLWRYLNFTIHTSKKGVYRFLKQNLEETLEEGLRYNVSIILDCTKKSTEFW